MNIFLIPKILNNIKIEDINIQTSNNKSDNNIIISETLHKYLTDIKNQIDNYIDSWDVYKKYTNPYEYIHTSYTNKSLCKLKPLSRSFYKMIEIICIA